MSDGQDSGKHARSFRLADLPAWKSKNQPVEQPAGAPAYQPAQGEVGEAADPNRRYNVGPHGEYLGANNPLDRRRERSARYPDEPVYEAPYTPTPKPVPTAKDSNHLDVPPPPYGSQPASSEPGRSPFSGFRLAEEQPVATPTQMRGNETPDSEIPAAAQEFHNNWMNLLQPAYNAVVMSARGNRLENWRRGGVATTVAWGSELAIDKVTGLDKNETAHFRILADLVGPLMAVSGNAIFGGWRRKILLQVGLHELGRVADKWLENNPQFKKFCEPPDA